MAFSYHWSREEQRKWAEQRLFRYVRQFIDDFHPYYRGFLREQGIDSKRIYSYDDFSRIPVTRRQNLPADGKAFIMQPGTDDGADDGAYNVKPLSTRAKLGYAARAYTTRYLRDVYAPPRSFKERREQAVMYDWLPAHFTFSQGTTGTPCSAVYTASDMHGIVRKVQGMLYAAGWEPGMRAMNLFPAQPNLNYLAFAALADDVNAGGSFLNGRGSSGSGAIPVERQVEMASGLGVEMLISPPGLFARLALDRHAIEGAGSHSGAARHRAGGRGRRAPGRRLPQTYQRVPGGAGFAGSARGGVLRHDRDEGGLLRM